jgi:hypothetical protein
MVAVTYGVARVPAEAKQRAIAATPGKNLFARFMQALMESRMRQAEREIARHAHLLPPDMLSDLTSNKDELPFGGW